MFEVAGSIRDFAAACRKVLGLEYLAEQDTEFEPDDDFWVIDTDGREPLEPRLEGRSQSVGGDHAQGVA